LTVDCKVLGHDVVKLVNQLRHDLDLVGVDGLKGGFCIVTLSGLCALCFLGLLILLGLDFVIVFNRFEMSLERALEVGLQQVETFLKLVKSLLLEHSFFVILLEVADKVVHVLHLLLVEDALHCFENRVVLVFQGQLVIGQLLLLVDQALVLHLNFVHQIVHQTTQLHVQLLLRDLGVRRAAACGGELGDELELFFQFGLVEAGEGLWLSVEGWFLVVMVLLVSFFVLAPLLVVLGLAVLHLVDHLLLEEHGVHLVELVHLQTLVHLLGVLLLLLLVLVGSHHRVELLALGPTRKQVVHRLGRGRIRRGLLLLVLSVLLVLLHELLLLL